jgi:diguanylate cyclase (GGDEF)-like protein
MRPTSLLGGAAAEARAQASLDDVRSSDPAVRLLENSWGTRSDRMSPRELIVEAAMGGLFLCIAIPLALAASVSHTLDLPLAGVLVALYALTTWMIVFPIGAGNVVPSYLVLVPMLFLLPPGDVPLLAALGLVAGSTGEAAAGRADAKRIVSAIPNAWHVLGPAVVLLVAGSLGGGLELGAVYLAAFVAGCLLDLLSATVREVAITGVRPRVQLRVISFVWLVDAGVWPLGLLLAHAMRHDTAAVLLILPFTGVLWLVSRDRDANLAEAQRRLELVAHERARLQSAVGRLGQALVAKLDLEALADLVLHGTIEALDADAGIFSVGGPLETRVTHLESFPHYAPVLQLAADRANAHQGHCELERDGVWALALPFGFASDAGNAGGAVAVARRGRAFRDDEKSVMSGLVDRARHAAADIVSHQRVREQAVTDPLTGLGNRRKLAVDMDYRMATASASHPFVLILFDLDGFKSYNDTFGHQAGDAILARLGGKLAAAVSDRGAAYRLGGDEFCVLVGAAPGELGSLVAAAAGALEERGENFAVGASYGAVLLPHEARNLDYALQLADERMYTVKRGRSSLAGDQTRDVLMRIMHAKQPSLENHSSEVAQLCLRVGRRFAMSAEALDELARAAELHDVGKVGIPDAILNKPGALNEAEWDFIRQHTVLGERILSAAPALRPVAALVRASHERWDGRGYPDGLAAEQIPLGARIIAACDAYEAMTSDRCYHARRDHDGALEELRREAAHQFDPDVIDVLIDEINENGMAISTHDAREGRAQSTDEVAAYLSELIMRHAPEQVENKQ